MGWFRKLLFGRVAKKSDIEREKLKKELEYMEELCEKAGIETQYEKVLNYFLEKIKKGDTCDKMDEEIKYYKSSLNKLISQRWDVVRKEKIPEAKTMREGAEEGTYKIEVPEKGYEPPHGKQIQVQKITTRPISPELKKLMDGDLYQIRQVVERCHDQELDATPLILWYESYKIFAGKVAMTTKNEKYAKEVLKLTGEELFYHIAEHLLKEGRELLSSRKVRQEPNTGQWEKLLVKPAEKIAKKIKEKHEYLDVEVKNIVRLLERGGMYSTEHPGLDIDFVNPLYWICGGYIDKYKLKGYQGSTEKSKYIYPLDYVLQILESVRKDPNDLLQVKV